MRINAEKAAFEIIRVADAFFQGNHFVLSAELNLSNELITEGFEQLKSIGNGIYHDLTAPPSGCSISVEEDDEDQANEDAPIRIYKLNTGGWGYEMDTFKSGKKTDLTMRGELASDFNESRAIQFYMFEVM